MSEQPPVFARDYATSAVQARYGYYASVLRPGMTQVEFRNAILNIQSSSVNSGIFVTRLNQAEIDEFYNRYEVVASSSQLSVSAAKGLDALVSAPKVSWAVSVG